MSVEPEPKIVDVIAKVCVEHRVVVGREDGIAIGAVSVQAVMNGQVILIAGASGGPRPKQRRAAMILGVQSFRDQRPLNRVVR